MTAPNKIYIRPMQNPSDGYVGIAWSDKHGEMTEYIRKDALLEWAKERKKQMKIEAGGCWNMHATGEYMAMDKLIEKLESM